MSCQKAFISTSSLWHQPPLVVALRSSWTALPGETASVVRLAGRVRGATAKVGATTGIY